MEPADLRNRFTYHPPSDDETIARYANIRRSALVFAQMLNESVPDGREKSLAITHLEEVVFWANAAIARAAPLPEGALRE